MFKKVIITIALLSALSCVSHAAFPDASPGISADTGAVLATTGSIPVADFLFAKSEVPVLAVADGLPGVSIPDVVITEDLMTKPLFEWQLNLTTILLVTMILGRVLQRIRSGGGLRQIVSGIWLGDNSPPS